MGQIWVDLVIQKEANEANEEKEEDDQQFVPNDGSLFVDASRRMTLGAGSFKRMSHTFTLPPLGRKGPT